jgi:hypothetical protein
MSFSKVARKRNSLINVSVQAKKIWIVKASIRLRYSIEQKKAFTIILNEKFIIYYSMYVAMMH